VIGTGCTTQRELNLTLSRETLLKSIGADRAGQDAVFLSIIRDARQFACDLTKVYLGSGTVSFSEFGFMDEDLPQINVVLLYSIDEHLPTMIHVIP